MINIDFSNSLVKLLLCHVNKKNIKKKFFKHLFFWKAHGNKKNEVNQEFFEKFECKEIEDSILEELIEEIAIEEKIKYKDYDPTNELDIESIGFITSSFQRLDDESKSLVQDLQKKFEKFKQFVKELQQEPEDDFEKETIEKIENEESDDEYVIKDDSKIIVETKHHVENTFQSTTGENIFYQYWLPEQEVIYEPKRMAIINYDFDAQDAIELSVKSGNEVKVLEDRYFKKKIFLTLFSEEMVGQLYQLD